MKLSISIGILIITFFILCACFHELHAYYYYYSGIRIKNQNVTFECLRDYEREIECVSDKAIKLHLESKPETVFEYCGAIEKCFESKCHLSLLYHWELILFCDYKLFFVGSMGKCVEQLFEKDIKLVGEVDQDGENIRKYCDNGADIAELYTVKHNALAVARGKIGELVDHN
ncbi:unnamed protein product [Caenorhabditis angaria]|uniref:Uncharacterized protein n=1 Tax=Caenorhabditis angaria TaxID=860376 RepID=A0A9P1N8S9_9PELO|nr:unnamed protein product [Caenorhabditis angaria]